MTLPTSLTYTVRACAQCGWHYPLTSTAQCAECGSQSSITEPVTFAGMGGYREIVPASGSIHATDETILAVSSAGTMNSPGGLCLIRADVQASFPNGEPAGLILRIYNGAVPSESALASWVATVPFSGDLPVGTLANGMWPVAGTHSAGAPGAHQHCVTAQQMSGSSAGTYQAMLEIALAPAAY